MNSNMSMAIICMVNNTDVENGTLVTDDIYDPNAAKKVDWSAEDQGLFVWISPIHVRIVEEDYLNN